MIKSLFTSGAIFLLSLSLLKSAVAQAPQDEDRKLYLQYHYHWAYLQWDKEDPAYSKARRELEAMPWDSLKKEFDGTAGWFDHTPAPLPFFRYMTASYLGATKYHQNLADSNLSQAMRLVDRIVPPANADYARIHYLMLSHWGPNFDLKDLALRLCALDSKDYDVRFYLCKSLEPEFEPDFKAQSLKLCDELSHIEPSRAGPYSLRGSIYFRLWLISKAESDRAESIKMYNRYLELAPPEDNFRPQAKTVIELMKKPK